MKNKIFLILTIVLIILVLIIFMIWKMNTNDYSKISSTFYEKLLEDYLSNNDEEVVITSQSFINLSSQKILSIDLINEILNNVRYKNIKFIDNDNIEPEQKNIILKFSNYDIKSIKFEVYTYYGKELKEVRTYIGNYKNDSWNLELRNLSYSDY